MSQGDEAKLTTCFGFDMVSALKFEYLRAGSGDPLHIEHLGAKPDGLGVGPHLTEVPAREGKAGFCIHHTPHGYDVRVQRAAWFRVDPSAPSISFYGMQLDPWLETILWGIPVMLCIMARGDMAMHTAAVEVGGAGLLLAAPGGFGKTTLAAGFLRSGYRFLSEDLICCRLGQPALLFPGPAVLRVRHDVASRLEVPGTHTLTQDSSKLYLAVDDERRGSGDPVPLRAVVLLRRGSGNPRLELVDPTQALPDLWSLTLNLPTDADRARCFADVSDLASQVPVFNLYRELRLDNLEQVVEAIIDTCLSQTGIPASA